MNMNNYSMIQHSFPSPLRGATITASAAVPINSFKHREMSSSPYLHKKRTDVRKSFALHLKKLNFILEN